MLLIKGKLLSNQLFRNAIVKRKLNLGSNGSTNEPGLVKRGKCHQGWQSIGKSTVERARNENAY